MKRIVLWFVSTLTAVVLLFSYKTSLSPNAASPQSVALAPVSTSTKTGSASASSTDSVSSTSTGSSSTGSASASASASTGTSTNSSTTQTKTSAKSTVTGSVVETRWGPVQVQLVISGGKITSVNVLQYPSSNGRDAEINSYALPVLVQETVKAQSAKIDMVSGATYTSEGYLQSLQSALDKANL